MKIVNIIGGLGNQMFQYALFSALCHRFPNEKILVDTSHFDSYKVHNGLELERVFGISLPKATFRDRIRVTYPISSYKAWRAVRKIFPRRHTECFENVDYTFNDHVFDGGDRYYEGYWQNYNYFKDILTELIDKYTFKLPINNKSSQLLSELKCNDCESVSIHVRRGDYLLAPNYAGLCNIDYYLSAIDHILKSVNKPTFYIFSDDIDWCHQNIAQLLKDNKYVFVDWNKRDESPLDMLLMSNCHHNIIANSSFSWWAACLNKNTNKIVCAPAKWTNTKVNCKFQMPEWLLF